MGTQYSVSGCGKPKPAGMMPMTVRFRSSSCSSVPTIAVSPPK
jgi:hypothetical protein